MIFNQSLNNVKLTSRFQSITFSRCLQSKLGVANHFWLMAFVYFFSIDALEASSIFFRVLRFHSIPAS